MRPHQIITRKQAQTAVPPLMFYFTGKECTGKYGPHLSERYTNSTNCEQCRSIANNTDAQREYQRHYRLAKKAKMVTSNSVTTTEVKTVTTTESSVATVKTVQTVTTEETVTEDSTTGFLAADATPAEIQARLRSDSLIDDKYYLESKFITPSSRDAWEQSIVRREARIGGGIV